MSFYGTSHFVNRAAAIRYYAIQEGGRKGVAKLVDEKLANGEISLGAPPIGHNQTRMVNDEGRYCIGFRPVAASIA